ncbi:hypothetical protein MNV_1070037 [Candidatus Methanoperedens nitroreducens]|uniref:Uncharacterized protein n=1 Tax=Candidatus Methanoperedens nitratireducens TaxID=1392998 RepID=A0A284VIX2_9EURY|nr:hypothetical protein MNV_1070037 [Candidatus Methanoperedens nitroreducens]
MSKLDEEELAKDLHVALNSADVKKLKEELESRGYEQRLANATGLIVTKADGNLSEGVILPFSSQDNTQVGIIAEVNTHKVVKAAAVLIYRNETKFPVSVEQLSINHGKVTNEKIDVASVLNSGVSIQVTQCDACITLYELGCDIGCGLEMALLCIIAGLGLTFIGGLACTAIAAAVCYFINNYGCYPQAPDACDTIGFC